MEGSILTAIMAVFTVILEWFGNAFTTVSAMFYAEGALTLPGVCVVLTLGIAVFTLVFGMIRSLLRGRN